MKEVGLSAAVEVEDTTKSIDVSNLSDFDLLMSGLAESEHSADNDLAERFQSVEDRRAETLQKIDEYYGSEIIHYHSYKGTAVDVAQRCPAAALVVEEGFEAFKNWVEDSRTAEYIEPAADEPSEEETETSAIDRKVDVDKEESPTEAKSTVEVGRTEKIEKRIEAEKPDKNVDVVIKSVEKVQVAPAVVVPVVVRERTIEKAPNRESVEIKPVDSKPDLELPVTDSQPVRTPVVEYDALKTIEVEAKDASEDVDFNIKMDAVEPTNHEPLTDSIEAESQITHEVYKEDVIDTGTEFITEQNEQEAGVAAELVVDSDSETDLDLEFESALVSDLDSDSETESEMDTESVQEYNDNVDVVFEHFEHWHEVAKEQPPLEDFLIEIINEVERPHLIATDDELVDSELQESVDNVEVSSDDTVIDLFDADISDEARVEIIALLKPVKTARKSLDRLFEARTHAECTQHFNELRLQLTILLQSLGYENPELIVTNFLKNHSPQSLKDLVSELEKSLRRAAYRTALQKKFHHAKRRNTRLNKFINYIMGAVTSTQGTSLATN